MSKTNIFGLLREEVTVAGIPLLKRQSLTPQERVWLQENSEALRIEFNRKLLALTDAVQDKLKYKTQAEAFHAVQQYRRNELEVEAYDKIDLINMADPLMRDRDVDEIELSYLLNSRIIKDKFPAAEFSEAFGIEYANTWTIDHTKAIAEIHLELTEFFASESEGKKSDSAGVTGK